MPARVRGGNRIKAALQSAKTRSVKDIHAGVFNTAKYQDGTPVASVAAWNEFGTQNKDGSTHSPERPAIRAAAKLMRAPIRNHVRLALKGSKGIMDRTTANQVGMIAQREIQKSIRDGDWAENAEATKRMKRRNKRGTIKPLIDTALYRRSISYRVID